MDSDRNATDVFRLLSDGTRLDVLRALAIAQHEERETGVATLSFSDVYERVDVENTSKLSYHLGELTDTFVRKEADGYSFTHAGERIVRFVLAGNYRRPSDVGTIEIDGRCLHCGDATLGATLEDQYFVVRCSACDRLSFSYRITPALVRSRDGTDLVDAVAREQAGDLHKARRGVCPDCAGRLETSVIDANDVAVAGTVPASFVTAAECRECLRFLSLPLTHAAAYHPASVAFHWDHGVDVLGRGAWEFHRHLHDGRWTAERPGDDPAEYRVTLRRDTASLRLYLDGDAAVAHTERVRRDDRSERRT